jgi:hypothetical protein
MNLSCINEHIRVYAENSVGIINDYVKTMYPSYLISIFVKDSQLKSKRQHLLIAFKQDCYFKLRSTLSVFNYAINGESCFEYYNILHIYSFLKSQVLSSYPEINFEKIISDKLANQIPMIVDDFIGLYVYATNNHIIGYSHYKLLLTEYKIKAHVQSLLMNKVRFKLLMQDYEENPTEYQHNHLDKLLGNSDLTRYISTFIN